MNRPNRDRAKRKKPVKKRREGYTGERAKKQKLRAKGLAQDKQGVQDWKTSGLGKTSSKFLNRESLTWKNLRASMLKRFKKQNLEDE